jgi:anti-sigma regulatory factor (Ser/Thr protein kinase)
MASLPVGSLLRASYPDVPPSCGVARREVLECLSLRGVGGDALEVAALALSELFGNALRHHKVRESEVIGVTVRLSLGPGGIWVVISVLDAGHGALGIPGAGPETSDSEEYGRGLLLLRGLGARVSGSRVRLGYRVEARFPMDAVVRSRVCRCGCQEAGHDYGRWCLWLVPSNPGLGMSGDRDVERWDRPGPVCSACRAFDAGALGGVAQPTVAAGMSETTADRRVLDRGVRFFLSDVGRGAVSGGCQWTVGDPRWRTVCFTRWRTLDFPSRQAS